MLTELRKDILKIIKNADKPLNARKILDSMNSRPNLSTVYRALDYMEKHGFIQSIAFFEGTRFYYSMNKHAHFLLCKECHEIQEFEHCTAHKILGTLEKEYNYRITDHVLFFRGICMDCRKVIEKKARFS